MYGADRVQAGNRASDLRGCFEFPTLLRFGRHAPVVVRSNLTQAFRAASLHTTALRISSLAFSSSRFHTEPFQNGYSEPQGEESEAFLEKLGVLDQE